MRNVLILGDAEKEREREREEHTPTFYRFLLSGFSLFPPPNSLFLPPFFYLLAADDEDIGRPSPSFAVVSRILTHGEHVSTFQVNTRIESLVSFNFSLLICSRRQEKGRKGGEAFWTCFIYQRKRNILCIHSRLFLDKNPVFAPS